MNGYVPPRQLVGALQSALQVGFFAATNLHPFLVHRVEQADDGARAFP